MNSVRDPMRIISGRFKGRRLAPVKGDIRPTSDRLRESLFSALSPWLEGAVWLDAFAGSGAVGLEALSRGAALVVFNEKELGAGRVLKRNLEKCGVQEGFRLVQMDALTLLRNPGEPFFDFLFLDPPYRFERYGKLLRAVTQCPAFTEDTLVLLEVFKKTPSDFIPPELEHFKTIEAGDSRILFIRKGVRSGG